MTDKLGCVTGLGTAVVDYVGLVDHYPAPDTQVEMQTFIKQPGGNVATALVSLARLGVETRFLGKFGDDELASLVKSQLESHGVDLSRSHTVAGGSMGFAFIVVETGTGKRTILWTNDGKAHLSESEIDENTIAQSTCLHLDHYSMEAAITAARLAKKHHTPVVLDAESLPARIDDLIPLVDVLIVCANFARAYTGETDDEIALDKLMRDSNAHTVVITDGANGSYCRNQTQRHRQYAFEVTPIDTTGCGDVFHGAFIYGMLNQWPLARQAEFASAAAALNTRGLGGQTAIPDLAEVEQFLKQARLRN